MIEIPGTLAGLPAIQQMLYEGTDVNITLLFSVAHCYLKGLERRVGEAKSRLRPKPPEAERKSSRSCPWRRTAIGVGLEQRRAKIDTVPDTVSTFLSHDLQFYDAVRLEVLERERLSDEEPQLFGVVILVTDGEILAQSELEISASCGEKVSFVGQDVAFDHRAFQETFHAT